MSRERIAIVNGRVIDPASGTDAVMPVYLAEGSIVALGAKPDGFTADRELDASGLVVCPGLVDLCARLREPGQEYKGTILSETRAAAAGGITTLICPPDTDPIVDTPAVARLIRSRSQRAGFAKVEIMGAMTRDLAGKELSEMYALRDAGCRSVTNAQFPLANPLVLRRAMEYAATCGLVVVIRPDEPSLRGAGCVHEGVVGGRLGLPGIPVTAETVAVAQALALVEESGVQVHFGQLSSARAVEMVAQARARGNPVSADVAVHHLHLTEEAVGSFDAHAHVLPPFRSTADRLALRRALAAGAVGAICSDHQPHELDAKLDAFPSTESGVAALELLLPLTLQLVDEGELDLATAVARLTCGPADIFGMPVGRLAKGASADLCLFDPRTAWSVEQGQWLSSGRNTPYWGRPMKGRVWATLVAGELVYRVDGSVFGTA
ncbi:MAG: dihydroorotase [Methylococcaceae bacterium]|nr:dihydroorotase [Methylococcaceae bacterium]